MRKAVWESKRVVVLRKRTVLGVVRLVEEPRTLQNFPVL